MTEIDLIWGAQHETEKPAPKESKPNRHPEKSGKRKSPHKPTASACIFLSATNETTRSDIKALLFCYNPKKIRIVKPKNSSSEYYATAELPNTAMALHAIQTFHNSSHGEVIRYDRPLQVSLHRSRAQNKKMRFAMMKQR